MLMDTIENVRQLDEPPNIESSLSLHYEVAAHADTGKATQKRKKDKAKKIMHIKEHNDSLQLEKFTNRERPPPKAQQQSNSHQQLKTRKTYFGLNSNIVSQTTRQQQIGEPMPRKYGREKQPLQQNNVTLKIRKLGGSVTPKPIPRVSLDPVYGSVADVLDTVKDGYSSATPSQKLAIQNKIVPAFKRLLENAAFRETTSLFESQEGRTKENSLRISPQNVLVQPTKNVWKLSNQTLAQAVMQKVEQQQKIQDQSNNSVLPKRLSLVGVRRQKNDPNRNVMGPRKQLIERKPSLSEPADQVNSGAKFFGMLMQAQSSKSSFMNQSKSEEYSSDKITPQKTLCQRCQTAQFDTQLSESSNRKNGQYTEIENEKKPPIPFTVLNAHKRRNTREFGISYHRTAMPSPKRAKFQQFDMPRTIIAKSPMVKSNSKSAIIIGSPTYNTRDFLTGSHPITTKQHFKPKEQQLHLEDSENAGTPVRTQSDSVQGPKFIEGPILGYNKNGSFEDWKFPSLATSNSIMSGTNRPTQSIKQKHSYLGHSQESSTVRSNIQQQESSILYNKGMKKDAQMSTDKTSRLSIRALETSQVQQQRTFNNAKKILENNQESEQKSVSLLASLQETRAIFEKAIVDTDYYGLFSQRNAADHHKSVQLIDLCSKDDEISPTESLNMKKAVTTKTKPAASPERAYTNMTPLRIKTDEGDARAKDGGAFLKQRKSLEIFRTASAQAALYKLQQANSPKQMRDDSLTKISNGPNSTSGPLISSILMGESALEKFKQKQRLKTAMQYGKKQTTATKQPSKRSQSRAQITLHNGRCKSPFQNRPMAVKNDFPKSVSQMGDLSLTDISQNDIYAQSKRQITLKNVFDTVPKTDDDDCMLIDKDTDDVKEDQQQSIVTGGIGTMKSVVRADTELTEKVIALQALKAHDEEDLVVVQDDDLSPLEQDDEISAPKNFDLDLKGQTIKTITQVNLNPSVKESIENFKSSARGTGIVNQINASQNAKLHASDDGFDNSKLEALIRSGLKTLFGTQEETKSPIKNQQLTPVGKSLNLIQSFGGPEKQPFETLVKQESPPNLSKDVKSASEVTLSPVIHLTQEEAASPVSVFKVTQQNYQLINRRDKPVTIGQLLQKSPLRGQQTDKKSRDASSKSLQGITLTVPPPTQREQTDYLVLRKAKILSNRPLEKPVTKKNLLAKRGQNIAEVKEEESLLAASLSQDPSMASIRQDEIRVKELQCKSVGSLPKQHCKELNQPASKSNQRPLPKVTVTKEISPDIISDVNSPQIALTIQVDRLKVQKQDYLKVSAPENVGCTTPDSKNLSCDIDSDQVSLEEETSEAERHQVKNTSEQMLLNRMQQPTASSYIKNKNNMKSLLIGGNQFNKVEKVEYPKQGRSQSNGGFDLANRGPTRPKTNTFYSPQPKNSLQEEQIQPSQPQLTSYAPLLSRQRTAQKPIDSLEKKYADCFNTVSSGAKNPYGVFSSATPPAQKIHPYASQNSYMRTSADQTQPFLLPPLVVSSPTTPQSERRSSVLEKKLNYTLVLDLDETLVHYDMQDGNYLVRPFCTDFLLAVTNKYEVVIFTAASKEYADTVLNALDPHGKLIQHRLYRGQCQWKGSTCVKDMRKLGRSLARTLIVDNLPENFSCTEENGVQIGEWRGDKDDTQLLALKDFLLGIVDREVPVLDIKPLLAEFKQSERWVTLTKEVNEKSGAVTLNHVINSKMPKIQK